ncbi:hypothetical protein BGZ76_006482 [Entomortierella beljakovae]|nr:hypothetical protein BGZ76_006482 [Entomortierella beljakovae]
MATYKQRTPYQRHTATYSDDENLQTSHTTTSSKQPSVNLNSYHNNLHQHHSTANNISIAEDDILENASDREWTSIRNSTANARAKARQQQYIDQQLQRTREWQFVLAQHHQSFLSDSHPSTAGREVTSDDYDELLSGTDTPSVVTSPYPVEAAPGAVVPGNKGHSGFLGFSDLISDGVESMVESEDLWVWSHDDEDPITMYKPLFRETLTSSSPLAASSTTSLNNLPRPSFAASPSYNSVTEPKFDNQMPFHDGSGNFFTTRSVRSNLESDIDSELGWESSSSRASPAVKAYRHVAVPRRRISSSEFKTVIQNIADLQHTSSRQKILQQNSRSRHTDSGYFFSPASGSRPHFSYPNVVTKRPIFNIYESDMEDMAAMVTERSSKISWMQSIEKMMTLMGANEYGGAHSSDPSNSHPIKALAHHLSPVGETALAENKDYPNFSSDETVTSESSATALSAAPASSSDLSSSQQLALQQVKQNMASASFDTMKRLQTRKRSNSNRRYSSDPMEVNFSPTVRDGHHSTYEDAHQQQQQQRKERRRSTGTSTSMSDTNLLAVFISTLRHFRDQVKSNFLYASELYEDEERLGHSGGINDMTRSLGFDGDLGFEWSANGSNQREQRATIFGGQEDNTASTSSINPERFARRHERSPSFASSSRSSSRQNIRRVGSDCGLESMKHYRSRESHHSIHSSHHRHVHV